MVKNQLIINTLNDICEILLLENALKFDVFESQFVVKKNLYELDSYFDVINQNDELVDIFKKHLNCNLKNAKLMYNFNCLPGEVYPSLLIFLVENETKQNTQNIIAVYPNCILDSDGDIYDVNNFFIVNEKQEEFNKLYNNKLFVVKNDDLNNNQYYC